MIPTVLAQVASDTYSVVGLLLTLIGLLATFFSVQLSQWLMSLLELRAKWKAHVNNSSNESQDALREARATYQGLSFKVVLLVTIPLAAFVAVTIVQAFKLLAGLAQTPEKSGLFWSLLTFTVCFAFLTCTLLIWGYCVRSEVGDEMKKKDVA